MLGDTLYIITTTSNAKDAIIYYEKVMNSELKNNYHTGIFEMTSLLEKIKGDSLHSESEYLANYFINKTEDSDLIEWFKYFKLIALEGQGKYKEAITLVQPLLENGNYKELWQTNLKRLIEKLNK